MDGFDSLLQNKFLPKDMSKTDTFYYDETNNIRKFVLREENFNNDISNSYFVLGGLIIKQGQTVDINKLMNELKLQKSVKEMKFKNLAGKRSNYADLLSNKRIVSFIKWLVDSDIQVHYTCLNFVFYSLTDIVDSLAIDEVHMNTLVHYHLQLKTALYNEVIKNLGSYLELLFRYEYPNIEKAKIKEFMGELYDIYFLNYEANNEPEGFYIELLRQMLKTARRADEMVFLHDNNSYILIDDFSMNYIVSMVVFPNSKHIFDNEVEVEDKIRQFDIEGHSKIDFTFIDSKSDKFIQLSDAFIGIISKFLSFIEWTDEDELLIFIEKMTPIQIETQQNLMRIINRSEQYSQYTTQFIGTLTFLDKLHKYNRLIDEKSSLINKT